MAIIFTDTALLIIAMETDSHSVSAMPHPNIVIGKSFAFTHFKPDIVEPLNFNALTQTQTNPLPIAASR